MELAAGAGRGRHAGHPRRHVRAVRSLDGLPRPARPGLAGQPGRGASPRPEGAGRGGPAFVEPRHVTVDPARIGGPNEPSDIPFEGLRRNAVALVAGLVLLLVIGFLVPDLTPAPTQPVPVEVYRGRIVEFLPPTGDPTDPDVRIVVLDGALQGQTVDGHLQGPSGAEALPRYQVGDEVIVNASTDPEFDVHRRRRPVPDPGPDAAAHPVRRRRDGRRWLARRSLADRPRPHAGRDHQDRGPADHRRARPRLGRDRGGDRGDHRDPAADRGRPHPDRGRGHRDVRLAGAGGAPRGGVRRACPVHDVPRLGGGGLPAGGGPGQHRHRRPASWPRSSSAPSASSTT